MILAVQQLHQLKRAVHTILRLFQKFELKGCG
jgi:hypothetical protein